MPHRARPAIGLTAALSMFAAGAAANPIDRIRPDAPVLAPYGIHSVGVKTLSVTIPDSIDLLNIDGGTVPRYDRPLTLEVWYPASKSTTPGGSYRAVIRDGVTEVTLPGQAVRDAPPPLAPGFL